MTDYSKIVPGEPQFKTHDDEIREPLEQEIEQLEQQLAECQAQVKQAKRDALLDMAETLSTLNSCEAVGEYYRKAKELE